MTQIVTNTDIALTSEQRADDYVLPMFRRSWYHARTRTKLGDRSFAAAGSRLWNSLRQSETIATFKRHLKTFLFSD